jgi:hypothetical protein
MLMLAGVCAQAVIVRDTASVNDLSKDGEASLFYGDYFHAYRSFSYLEEEKQASFAREGLEGYLQSLFVIGSANQIAKECGDLSGSREPALANKTAYICGQHYTEIKDAENAQKYLPRITRSSKYYWPARILWASAALITSDPQEAISLLKPQEFKIYAGLDLGDQFSITLARAYTAENKFDDALKNYQSIPGESKLYVEALEETAWVFFKMRRFESAQVLLDVLLGQYESAQRLGQEQQISPFTYFRCRYLKAYLALVEQRTEGAASEFAELRAEYEKALEKLKPALNADEVLTLIRRDNQKWTDVRNIPEKLSAQLKYIGEWMGADVEKDFESQIYFQMALSREIKRADSFTAIYTKESPGYRNSLESLRDKTWDQFSDRYSKAMAKLTKELNTLKIKAELGRLEIVWMKRAEGARTLDEVIDNYRQEARSIDEVVEQ